MALVWTLCLSVGYTLVGSLSDIFGRRWFFIGASSLAVIGCIVGATAQTVNALIGANVLIGLAASGQLSFNYTIAELVPVKDRFFVLSFVFLFAVPFSSFGPYISRLFIVHTAQSWRWDYYLSIIISQYPETRLLVSLALITHRCPFNWPVCHLLPPSQLRGSTRKSSLEDARAQRS